MIPEVANVASIAKTAYELGKELLAEVKKKADAVLEDRLNRLLFLIGDLNMRIIELQKAIFHLQQRLTELEKQKEKLESEIEAARRWEVEKTKYELAELVPGVSAYRLKDPEHHPVWLCPNCFEKRRKSIIQLTRDENGRYFFRCFECSFESWAPPPTALRSRVGVVRSRSRGF